MTAREALHDLLGPGAILCVDPIMDKRSAVHTPLCNAMTSLIEAREAAARTAERMACLSVAHRHAQGCGCSELIAAGIIKRGATL